LLNASPNESGSLRVHIVQSTPGVYCCQPALAITAPQPEKYKGCGPINQEIHGNVIAAEAAVRSARTQQLREITGFVLDVSKTAKLSGHL